MDFSFSDLNFNSVENLPGFEARAAFTVNSASVFREDVDIVSLIFRNFVIINFDNDTKKQGISDFSGCNFHCNLHCYVLIPNYIPAFVCLS
ncbi:MAG: hypothetical protein K2M94_07900 [Paramuribaculum sp.]|nr:hypothetical protein [Paramuribaculum sp.]